MIIVIFVTLVLAIHSMPDPTRPDREKAERVHDPNVEYIDVDDFKAGGKFGGPSPSPAAGAGASAAASVLPPPPASIAIPVSEFSSSSLLTSGIALSSSMWTELLD